MAETRDGKGRLRPGHPFRFKPGQSGNPQGRPKEIAEIRDLARSYSPNAMATLNEIAKNKKVSPAARVAAAIAILDRAYGRPVQAVTAGEGGGAMELFAVMVAAARGGAQPAVEEREVREIIDAR